VGPPAKFLGLSPATVVNTLYSKPERIPPRVAHMTALRWSPLVCRQWAASPASKRPKMGRKRLGSNSAVTEVITTSDVLAPMRGGRQQADSAIIMYEAFDHYLAVSSWHSDKDGDRRRFYLALDKVVREPAFDPELMGDYMRAKVHVAASSGDFRDNAIARRTTDAWAVKDFLDATSAIKA
jgi:hypothetical protein